MIHRSQFVKQNEEKIKMLFFDMLFTDMSFNDLTLKYKSLIGRNNLSENVFKFNKKNMDFDKSIKLEKSDESKDIKMELDKFMTNILKFMVKSQNEQKNKQ